MIEVGSQQIGVVGEQGRDKRVARKDTRKARQTGRRDTVPRDSIKKRL